jgi:uncharacterized protein (TIGR02285 family)
MNILKCCIFISLLSLPLLADAQYSLTILSRAYNDDTTERTAEKRFYALFQQILRDEFNITTEWTNHARLIKRLSGTQPVCSYNLIKTKQREKLFLFSEIPTTMFVQRKLFGYKETLQGLPETVSVSKLLSNNKTFGILSSTSYQQLDTMFVDYQHQVASINSADSFAQLGQLLTHKRIDIIVDYEYTVKSFLSDEQYAQLDSRSISEYPEFINGYFACSQTVEGEKAITLVNQYMRTPAMYEFLKGVHYDGFDADTAKRMMHVYETKHNVTPLKPITKINN